MKTSYEMAKEQLKELLKNEIFPVELFKMVDERVYVIIYQDHTFFIADPLEGPYYLVDEDKVKPEWYTMSNISERTIVFRESDNTLVISKDCNGNIPPLFNIFYEILKLQEKGLFMSHFITRRNYKCMNIYFEPLKKDTMPTLD